MKCGLTGVMAGRGYEFPLPASQRPRPPGTAFTARTSGSSVRLIEQTAVNRGSRHYSALYTDWHCTVADRQN